MHPIVLALALSLLVTGCRSTTTSSQPAAAADVWATVDGRPIKQEDVEKAYRRAASATPPGDEEALTAKLDLLNELIVRDVLLQKAREFKLEVPESELEIAYSNAKKNISEEQFQKELASRKLTAADMRENLRQELLAQKVVEREVLSKVTVTDKEITDFFEANKARFNRPEEGYHLAQIVITPARAAQQVNRSGDDAGTPQEAATKAGALMERLKQGAPFAELAADYSEDPQSAQRGGDLGFVTVSQLQKQAQPLRDAVLNQKPGTINLVSIGGGHTIVAVVNHETAGQKDPSMPDVKQAITSAIRGPREQLLRAAYMSALRNDVDIVNHLAKRVVDVQGKVPPGIAPGK